MTDDEKLEQILADAYARIESEISVRFTPEYVESRLQDLLRSAGVSEPSTLCECPDSVRSRIGTCPSKYDREYGMCPKQKGNRS